MAFTTKVTGADTHWARVLNALRELTVTRQFPRRKYEDRDADPTTDGSVPPTGVTANEISATVEASPSLRGLTREYGSYTWEMRLEFAVEISTEDFDCDLMQSPPVIPATTEYPRQLTLALTNIEWSHPPRGATGGSRVTYTFDVTPGRI